MELAGKVALITGGGTGLGREVALRLAREGMNLAVNYAHSRQEAEQTVAELQAAGVRAGAFQADMAEIPQIRELVAQVERAFGRLDLLIHNAGTTRFIPLKEVEAVSQADWDRMFAVNTRSAFFLAQAAAPLLRRSGDGQIITTSSIAGLGTRGSSLPYCVSKAALIHLTKCLAVALAPDIRVNSVAPGLLMTRWVADFPAERLRQMADAALLKQSTDLADAAAAYVMLAKNRSMTGQVIVVDAGLLDGGT